MRRKIYIGMLVMMFIVQSLLPALPAAAADDAETAKKLIYDISGDVRNNRNNMHIYQEVQNGKMSVTWDTEEKTDGGEGSYKIRSAASGAASCYAKADFEKIANTNYLDLSDLYDDGFIGFWIKSQSSDYVQSIQFSLVAKSYVENKTTINLKSDGYYTVGNDWTYVKIPINKFSVNGKKWSNQSNGWEDKPFDFSEVIRLAFIVNSAPGKTGEAWLQDIGIYKTIYPASPEIVSAEMDKESGMYAVDVSFSKKLDAGTVNESNFSIGQISASEVRYDDNEQKCRVLFDMQPDFPSELIMSIGGGLRDKDGLAVNAPELTVKNSNVQDKAAVQSFTQAPAFADGSVKCAADIKCIYAPEESGQEVALFMAVYDGDKLVGCAFSTKKALTWKSEEEFEVSVPNITVSANLRAELYVIDSEESGKPLAEKAVYAVENSGASS